MFMLSLIVLYTCVCLLADKMKDAVIAKVAAQAADFYKDANSASQVSTVKQQLEKVNNKLNNYT